MRNLDYCRGKIELPQGKLEVKWKRSGGIINLEINVPAGIEASLSGKKLAAGRNIVELNEND